MQTRRFPLVAAVSGFACSAFAQENSASFSHRQWFAFYYARSIPLTNPRWVETAGVLA
jgi:hypothetical protein